VLPPAELPGFIVASLPDWQNEFTVWALVLGASLVLGGGGLLRRRSARPQTRTDVLRAFRAGEHGQPLRASRTGWSLCAIGVAMVVFPFVNVNWLTTS
jgi:hypothetical protein